MNSTKGIRRIIRWTPHMNLLSLTFFKVTLLLAVAYAVSGCAPKKDAPKERQYVFHANKRVLIIGDSISAGYAPALRSIMPDSEIEQTPTSAKNSWFTSHNVDSWINTNEPYETIVWNNGLWDCFNAGNADPHTSANVPREWLNTTVEEYEQNLRTTAAKLIATGSRVVFLTTTYIPADQNGILMKGHEIDLNAVALRVLPEYGIQVVDMHPFSRSLPDSMRWYGYDIHYTDEGSEQLAKFIAQSITFEEI